MLDPTPKTPSVVGESDLRRQIDRSVSRALVDLEFASLLLSDPTVVLQDLGCTPQQHRTLQSIQAIDLLDFAHQAQSLFWAAWSPTQADQAPPRQTAALL